VYENHALSIKQPPISQAAKERANKNRAARGGPEAETDKMPCTSKFHFSKGKYGHIVLAWHGVLVQKVKDFTDICAQARKIFGATNVEPGNTNQVIDPEVRTRVGLDSESESGDDDHGAGHDGDEELENYGNDHEGDQNTGSLNDVGHNDDVGDGITNNQNEVSNAGPSELEREDRDSLQADNHDVDAEKNDGASDKETEEVGRGRHGGLSRLSRRGTKAARGRSGRK
jgi:hypothetical protein